MAVQLYFDVHVPLAIAVQLRRRGVDVLTAQEDSAAELPDGQLVERAVATGRVLLTFDKRLKGMLEEWQRQGREFSGLLWGRADASVGSFVKDLEFDCESLGPLRLEESDRICSFLSAARAVTRIVRPPAPVFTFFIHDAGY